MNIGEVLKTKRAKTLMGFIYSWGASVVLIGALFKLNHYPYSGVLLGIGLITEAIIFFVSAFEPPLEMPEWSRVYPELREDFPVEDMSKEIKPGKGRLEELLNGSDLTPDLLDKVSLSLNDLSNTARGISNISSATLATEQYVKNLSTASDSMSALHEVNSKANTAIHKSVTHVVDSYQSAADVMKSSGMAIAEKLNTSGTELTSKITESGNLLFNSYKTASEKIDQSVQQIGNTTGSYSENLKKMNSNISALNTALEMQLKGTENQAKVHQQFNTDLGKMNEILAASAEELKRYRENAAKLNQHLEDLTRIYGNMLGALNYKK
jgi:gliding motility-associated protein GldL